MSIKEYFLGFLFFVLFLLTIINICMSIESCHAPIEYISEFRYQHNSIHKEIQILGAVNNPGIKIFAINQIRLYEAISASDGLAQRANISAIEWGKDVSDAKLIVVPFIDQPKVLIFSRTKQQKFSKVKKSSKNKTKRNKIRDDNSEYFPININTAQKTELMRLPFIGTKTADMIIQHRKTRPFRTTVDIKLIRGIGIKKYNKLKSLITVR